MSRTYVNQINEVEVSLAVQRLLIGYYPQTFDPTTGRVDPGAPPTGYFDLGAVVEDTPSFSVTRNKFELDAGLPAVRQYEAIVGVSGSFEVSLHSQSWRKIQVAFGNFTAVSSVTALSTIASVTNQNVITFANTTDVQSIAYVGRQISIAPTASQFNDIDGVETKVASITNDGLTFYLLPTPINTIAVNDVVGYYDYVQTYVGGNEIKQYSLLAVADFIDGSQVVHEMFKGTAGDEVTEEITPEQNARIPLSFNLFGVKTNAVPGCSTDQLVVARRIYFPSLDVPC